MINNISWQGYWITIGLLTGMYYLVILLLYYRNDFKNRFGTRQVESISSAVPPLKANENDVDQPQLFSGKFWHANSDEEKPEVIPIVQSLKDEVQAFFYETHVGITKKYLLVSLQGICNKYPTVLETSHYSINQLIVFLAEQNCSIHLSAEEVSGVWLG